MTSPVLERPSPAPARGGGGLPARRAVTRWAWRMFRREWRQQLLILSLIVVAVAATLGGSAAVALRHGNRISKREPWPGRLTTSIVPP